MQDESLEATRKSNVLTRWVAPIIDSSPHRFYHQMGAPHVGNIRVLVLYPSGEGKSFNAEYWRSTHFDLLKNGVWKNAIDIEFSLGAADSPYVAVATVVFEDKDAFNSAVSDPGMAEVLADISKYTNIEPVVMNTGIIRNL